MSDKLDNQPTEQWYDKLDGDKSKVVEKPLDNNQIAKSEKEKKNKRWLPMIIGLWVLGSFFGMISIMMESKKPNSASTSVQYSAVTTTPAVVEKFIPGLTAADVKLNFSNKGFICDMQSDSVGAIWTCKDENSYHSFEVQAIGKDTSSISSVTATALNYGTDNTDATLKDFIGYVASLPFDGANPALARDWAKANIGKHDVETKYGGVTFSLSGTEDTRTRMLTISAE